MKTKTLYSLFAATVLAVGCTEEVTTELAPNIETVEEKVIIRKLDIDTAQSTITWRGYDQANVEDSEFHEGTVKTLSGEMELTETNGDMAISNAELIVDMNSIQTNEGLAKLENHLKSPDFFDINQFATTEFIYEKYEDGNLYGKIAVVGSELPIVCPVAIDETEEAITITSEPFKVDFTPANMPFFIEDAKQPVEEQHDPMLEFSIHIVAEK